MLIAQRLYEGIDFGTETKGLITYMRTDSTRLSSSFSYPALNYVKEQYGEEYAGRVINAKKKANVQDAHETIRPTSVHHTPNSVKKFLSKDEFALYKMIYSRR